MPINKEAFIRYRIIDECIRNKYRPYPSMDDLREKCEDKLGTSFSESTIQKDIKAMKEDPLLGYEAPIKYSKRHNGYYYSDPNFTIAAIPLNDNDIQAIEFAAATLQQFKGIQLFEDFDGAVDKIFNAVSMRTMLEEDEINQMIQFEKVPFFKGSEYLGSLLEAIQNRQVIEFDYLKFDSTESKHHVVHPYMLKEYRHRWYLIGMTDKNDYITTFGLDRMQNIEVNELPFRFNHDFDPKLYYKYSYGVTTFEGEPKKVVLSFTPAQGKYIETQPLHHTQTILKQNDKEFRIELEVGITIELVQDILRFGDQVKVIKPKKLVEEIKERLEKGLEGYL